MSPLALLVCKVGLVSPIFFSLSAIQYNSKHRQGDPLKQNWIFRVLPFKVIHAFIECGTDRWLSVSNSLYPWAYKLCNGQGKKIVTAYDVIRCLAVQSAASIATVAKQPAAVTVCWLSAERRLYDRVELDALCPQQAANKWTQLRNRYGQHSGMTDRAYRNGKLQSMGNPYNSRCSSRAFNSSHTFVLSCRLASNTG